ncbi:hypothetical protein ACHAXS_004174 [Conticribra weissflogii]
MTAVNPSTQGLSKSQKKRLKQKAKKQKEIEAQQAASTNANNSQNVTSVKAKVPADPNYALVETLLEQGFTREQISKAQDQLWEAVGSGEGGYDDVWAVSDLLVHLYGGDGGVGAEASDEEDDSDYEEESEEGSESEDSGEYEEESDIEVEKTADKNVLGLKEENAISTEEDIAMKNPEKQDEPQTRPISEKLRYVAQSVPQLADALFALTEWTTKSASREDLERYFLELNNSDAEEDDSSETPEGPLRTIISRVLLFQPQQQHQQHMDPSALVTGCANLLTCILLSPACNANARGASTSNNGAAHSSTLKKAFGEVLRRGRALAAQFGNDANKSEQRNDGPTPDEVASCISNTLLDLLKSAALEKAQREKSAVTIGNILGSHSVDPYSSNRSQPIQCTTQAQAQNIVRQMESEIASLMVKIVNKQRMPQNISNGKKALSPASLAVVDLISKRDRTKQIAEKSGVVLEVSAGCKHRFVNGDESGYVETMDENSKKDNVEDQKTQSSQLALGKYQSDESKEALAQKIVGAPLIGALAASVEEVKSYEAKVDQILSDVATKQINLSNRQTNLSFKRADISKRIEKLRRELEELERQDEQLVKEENEVSSELEELERDSEKELDMLKAKIAAKSTHVTVDREVKRTIEKLAELETACIRSSYAAVEPEPAAVPVAEPLRPAGPPISELLPIKLDQYLNRARSYFQSESQCVEFLRNRVSSAEAEVLDLERELQECTMLGMTTNVETTTQNLRNLKAHVDEDNVVIDALRGDAKAMRSDLIRRVEDYMELMKNEEVDADITTEVLTPSHIATLEGISIELTGIGFYDDQDGGLGKIFSKIPKRGCIAQSTEGCDEASPGHDNDNSSYIGTVDGSSPSPLTIPLDKVQTNGHSLPSHVHGSSASVVAKPTMPKFSWASKANDVPKNEKKSLLDIQREEMSAKEKEMK